MGRKTEYRLPENTFGDRMRKARLDADITALSIAEQIGVSHEAIVAFEQSKRTPSIYKARHIAEILHVSLDYLAGTGETHDQSSA